MNLAPSGSDGAMSWLYVRMLSHTLGQGTQAIRHWRGDVGKRVPLMHREGMPSCLRWWHHRASCGISCHMVKRDLWQEWTALDASTFVGWFPSWNWWLTARSRVLHRMMSIHTLLSHQCIQWPEGSMSTNTWESDWRTISWRLRALQRSKPSQIAIASAAVLVWTL